MSSGTPVVVLEFNELTPTLMWRFMSEGHLPNFSRLFSESHAFITDAGEDPPWLEPWIQWVTVHTGVPAREHKIFNLGDAVRTPHPSIWDIVSDLGHPVWVCGSMNALHQPDIRGEVLPDPWSVSVRPTPEDLNAYFDFVRGQVLEYTRAKSKYSIAEVARFIAFMSTNGLSLSTAQAIVSQLIRERLAPVRWRRATIMDRMQYDVFKARFRRIRPRLSTFFLNSTAHFQHVYWRNLEPDKFASRPSSQEQSAHGNSVLYGYQQMDRIVGQTLDLAGQDTAIVFASALSQQPCLKYEGSGGKRFYKPVDYDSLLRAVGIEAGGCEPEAVMSEQFHLRFSNPNAAKDAFDRLNQARVESRPVLHSSLDGASILTGCCLFEELPPDVELVCAERRTPFSSVFYLVDLKKSGMHHRAGMAWFRMTDRRHSDNREPIDLTCVAPTILAVLGIAKPQHMPSPVLDIA